MAWHRMAWMGMARHGLAWLGHPWLGYLLERENRFSSFFQGWARRGASGRCTARLGVVAHGQVRLMPAILNVVAGVFFMAWLGKVWQVRVWQGESRHGEVFKKTVDNLRSICVDW
jgi:hypothetical protein